MWLLWWSMQAAPVPAPQPPAWLGGRVVTAASLHVGVRPALLVTPGESALGVTVQLRVPLP